MVATGGDTAEQVRLVEQGPPGACEAPPDDLARFEAWLDRVTPAEVQDAADAVLVYEVTGAPAPPGEAGAWLCRRLALLSEVLAAGGGLNQQEADEYARLLAWEADRDAYAHWLARDAAPTAVRTRRRRPPEQRRPKRGDRRTAEAPAPPSEAAEVMEYHEIAAMVRRRAGRPRSTDREYLRVVAAAFSVYRTPGRRRDRPTVDEVQAALDRLRGVEHTEGGNRLYPWMARRFGDHPGPELTPSGAIEDARALRDAELDVRERQGSPGSHKRVTKESRRR